MTLSVPERLHSIAIDVFKLESDTRTEILNDLKSVEAGSTFDVYDAKLEMSLPDKSADWRSSLLAFVFSILNLTDIEKEPTAIADDVMMAFQEFAYQEIADADEDQENSFKDFLVELFAAEDSLNLGSKAYKLTLQHERNFVYSEIYSDIRHIFARKSPESKPIAGIITHSLKVHAHRDGDHEETYFALTHDDLVQLQSSVARALEKHKSLKNLLDEMNIKYISAFSEQKS